MAPSAEQHGDGQRPQDHTEDARNVPAFVIAVPVGPLGIVIFV